MYCNTCDVILKIILVVTGYLKSSIIYFRMHLFNFILFHLINFVDEQVIITTMENCW